MYFIVRSLKIVSVTSIAFGLLLFVEQYDAAAAATAAPVAEPAPIETPLPPDTSIDHATPAAPDQQPVAAPPVIKELTYPVRIRIPSIGVNSPIEHMGITANGELDVPSGRTNNVGWYKHGTVPGDLGSAVMDAHVYAAFKKLKYLKINGDVFIDMSDGTTLHYDVTHSMVYGLDDVPRELLFARGGGKYLHLITCAGRWNAARDTYTKRLIVYATLVE